jgi:hypothetical protein
MPDRVPALKGTVMMKTRTVTGATLAAVLAVGSAFPLRVAAAPSNGEVVIPENTVVRLKLEDRVGSRDSRVGDRFAATLSPSDRSGFPNGTRFQGEVTEVERKREDEPGVLNIRMRTAYLPDGSRVPLSGRLTSLSSRDLRRTSDGRLEARSKGGSGKPDWKWAGYGAAGGAVLSAILGGGVLKGALLGGVGGGIYSYLNRDKNKSQIRDVDLPAGTEFGMRLDDRVAFDDQDRYRYSARNMSYSEFRDYRSRGADDLDRVSDRNGNDRVAGERQEVRFNNLDVRMNGQAVRFNNAQPMNINGVFYVPLKPVAAAANMRVTQRNGEESFTLDTPDGMAQGYAGEARITMGGAGDNNGGNRDDVTLEETPMMINGVIYVSGEYLARVAGLQVDVDQSNGRLDLRSAR